MRRRRSVAERLVVFIMVFAGVNAANSPADADLHTFQIRTLEWLVDNSDVIAVLQVSPEASPDTPKILSTLKGEAGRISWPLTKRRETDSKGYQFYAPRSDGPTQLIFIRGRSEVLDAVALAREQFVSTPSIHDTLYGVTQFGDLILTQVELFETLSARIQEGPGQTIGHRVSSHTQHPTIWAAPDFPLESSGETYSFLVPFTTDRRDHYIAVLKSGNATARIAAIKQLSLLIDDKATDAIHKATTCSNVPQGYRYSWREKTAEVLTTEDVRKAAKTALQRIQPLR